MTTSEASTIDDSLLSDPPDANTLEISLFGPEKGESVVVHYGAGRWFIVDSCRDPASGIPAALGYLQRLGVDLGQVTHVVATHAHDDHVKGLAEILEACPAARFACSAALTGKEFMALVELDDKLEKLNRGVFKEFRTIDTILENRRNPHNRLGSYRYGFEGRPIVVGEPSEGIPQITVIALTPSDTAVTRALAQLASMYPTGGAKLPIGSLPNETCLALWIEAGDSRILLGADVEEGPDDCGWKGVLAWTERPTGLADVYKVAHHGADSGHHQPMWDQMLHGAPISILTANQNGSYSLPTADDLTRITTKSSRTFITAIPSKTDADLKERAQISRLGRLVEHPQPLGESLGHVRLRRRFGAGHQWEADTTDPATELTVELVQAPTAMPIKATSRNKSRKKADLKNARKGRGKPGPPPAGRS